MCFKFRVLRHIVAAVSLRDRPAARARVVGRNKTLYSFAHNVKWAQMSVFLAAVDDNMLAAVSHGKFGRVRRIVGLPSLKHDVGSKLWDAAKDATLETRHKREKGGVVAGVELTDPRNRAMRGCVVEELFYKL